LGYPVARIGPGENDLPRARNAASLPALLRLERLHNRGARHHDAEAEQSADDQEAFHVDDRTIGPPAATRWLPLQTAIS
jgi:hypothetical protein